MNSIKYKRFRKGPHFGVVVFDKNRKTAYDKKGENIRVTNRPESDK